MYFAEHFKTTQILLTKLSYLIYIVIKKSNLFDRKSAKEESVINEKLHHNLPLKKFFLGVLLHEIIVSN